VRPRTSLVTAAVDDGAVLLFDVPQDIDARRPLLLEVRAGAERARWRLDL
jgi:hypothetical protein